MKILITGATGMLGQAIVERFKEHELLTPNHDELDITDSVRINEFIRDNKPELIINCAAYTDVPTVEYNEEAYLANTKGPEYLAAAAKEHDAILVHFSTDYVFDGLKNLNEEYKENSETRPLNSYGKTKEEGDKAIKSIRPKYYIFRTSWLFGNGNNFVSKIMSLSEEQKELRIVSDEIGSPTYTIDLADIVYEVVINKKLEFGIYNATNLGFCSWYDFAKEFVSNDCKLIPVTAYEYGDKVSRPSNSKLSKQKLLDAKITIPMWQDALHRYLRNG